ncbi:MAG: replicative DNA helicase [Pseudomonadota bacterium]
MTEIINKIKNTDNTATGNHVNDDDLPSKSMPSNLKAEQAILGAILVNNEYLNRVADYLQDKHFFEPVHQRIFAAILKIVERGMTATPVSMSNYFDNDAALQELGGVKYLAKLTGIMTSIINVESYAKLIYDLYLKRQLINIGDKIVNDAFDNKVDETASDQLESAEKKLYDLATTGNFSNDFEHLSKSITNALAITEKAYQREGNISGIASGFTDLDDLLGGFQDSDLIILAGRPSMGKTALAINIAMKAVENLYKEAESAAKLDEVPSIGFFSLEMSAEQLASRIIAMYSEVNSSKMRTGNLTDDEFSQIIKASNKLHQLPFFIDDTPAISISALRTRARRLKRQNNLSMIFVDYLQLLRGTSKSSDSNRVQEVSEITQGLKAIAKELDVPVIALSQLSRAVEQREDKKPQLSDLRESGSIEQDADIVMFIYREEYYLARAEPSLDNEAKHLQWIEKLERARNKTTIIVAKQRHGPIGEQPLYFDANLTKFSNYSPALVENYKY